MAGIFAGIMGALKGLGGSLLGGLANGIGSLFGNSNAMGGLLSLFNQKRQFGYQMQLQNDAQSFNAEQAEINRNFNARQAEIARDWQENFYNKYQSPSAMMAQYQDAGINPMLVAGQGTVSPPSASSASGSAASSGLGSAPSGSLVADIIQMMMIKAQIKEAESRTNLNNAQADFSIEQANKARIDVKYSPLLYEMNLETGKVNIENLRAGIQESIANTTLLGKRVDEINQNIKESQSRVSLNEATRVLRIAEEVLTKQETETQKSLMWKYDSDKSLNFSTIGLNNANNAYISSRKLSEDIEREYLKTYGAKPPTVLLEPHGIAYLLGGKFKYKNGKW